MKTLIGPELALTQLPRSADLGDYDWFDLEWADTPVGKARCRVETGKLTVFSINVYPEFSGKGFGRAVIEHFKTAYPVLVADRVRYTAREFWIKVGFLPEGEDDYVWRR